MTVIMNKSDYIDKATLYLTLKYTGPRKTTVDRINQKLKQLEDKDKLNETIYHRIQSNNASAIKFYC